MQAAKNAAIYKVINDNQVKVMEKVILDELDFFQIDFICTVQ